MTEPELLAAAARAGRVGPAAPVFGGHRPHHLGGRLTLLEQPVGRPGRRVTIRQQGFADAVVWNPGAEACAQLSDMPDEDWQRMLCIETANVMDDVITLEPGASHTLGVSISANAL